MEELPKSAGVAIVGGGMCGISIAYYLASRGLRDVIVFEKGFMGEGATAAGAGGIRHQFSTEVNVRLSIESIRAFEELAQETGNAIELHQNGYLILATSDEEMAVFQKNVEMQRQLGVDARTLSSNEVQRTAPYLNTEDIVGATFCPNDGWVDPYSVLQMYARRARELGARIFERTEVRGIAVRGGKAMGIATPRGDLAADVVVNAAGPYAALVGRMAGVELPVKPYRRQSFATEPFLKVPEDAPFIVDFTTSFYFHKESNRGVLMGMSDRDEPSSFNTNVDWSFLEKVVERALHRSPILGEARVIRGWAGLYAITPDHNPVLGRTPVKNFYVACGFSGHGFMHSPAVGSLLAELISEKEPHLDITPLSLERFAEETVAEYTVI